MSGFAIFIIIIFLLLLAAFFVRNPASFDNPQNFSATVEESVN